MTNKLALSIVAVLLLAVPAARADSTAFSTFTAPVSGTLLGGNEKVSCKGPVRLSVMAQKDPSTPFANAIVTVDTTALACVGLSSRLPYGNTGHAILTRILTAKDRLEASIAVFPTHETGHLEARSAVVTLQLAYDTVSAALVSATATLANQ
jgi:hypothetical protein